MQSLFNACTFSTPITQRSHTTHTEAWSLPFVLHVQDIKEIPSLTDWCFSTVGPEMPFRSGGVESSVCLIGLRGRLQSLLVLSLLFALLCSSFAALISSRCLSYSSGRFAALWFCYSTLEPSRSFSCSGAQHFATLVKQDSLGTVLLVGLGGT